MGNRRTTTCEMADSARTLMTEASCKHAHKMLRRKTRRMMYSKQWDYMKLKALGTYPIF